MSDGYLFALALTLAVELPILIACAPSAERRTVLGTATAANLASHPIAYWLIAHLGASFLLVELGVALFEGAALWACTAMRPGRAMLSALLANCVSASLSFVL